MRRKCTSPACRGRKCYRTQLTAQREADRVAMNGKLSEMQMHTWRCGLCGAWHVQPSQWFYSAQPVVRAGARAEVQPAKWFKEARA